MSMPAQMALIEILRATAQVYLDENMTQEYMDAATKYHELCNAYALVHKHDPREDFAGRWGDEVWCPDLMNVLVHGQHRNVAHMYCQECGQPHSLFEQHLFHTVIVSDRTVFGHTMSVVVCNGICATTYFEGLHPVEEL